MALAEDLGIDPGDAGLGVGRGDAGLDADRRAADVLQLHPAVSPHVLDADHAQAGGQVHGGLAHRLDDHHHRQDRQALLDRLARGGVDGVVVEEIEVVVEVEGAVHDQLLAGDEADDLAQERPRRGAADRLAFVAQRRSGDILRRADFILRAGACRFIFRAGAYRPGFLGPARPGSDLLRSTDLLRATAGRGVDGLHGRRFAGDPRAPTPVGVEVETRVIPRQGQRHVAGRGRRRGLRGGEVEPPGRAVPEGAGRVEPHAPREQRRHQHAQLRHGIAAVDVGGHGDHVGLVVEDRAHVGRQRAAAALHEDPRPVLVQPAVRPPELHRPVDVVDQQLAYPLARIREGGHGEGRIDRVAHPRIDLARLDRVVHDLVAEVAQPRRVHRHVGELGDEDPRHAQLLDQAVHLLE